MEIYISNVSYATNKLQLTTALAGVLHNSEYSPATSSLMNFDVRLFPNKRRGHGHSGTGALTLTTEALGLKFLYDYGQPEARSTISLGNRVIKFSKSKRNARSDVVETIRHMPYRHPEVLEERERRARELQANSISVRTVQFGWECRDSVFSVEWEKKDYVDACAVTFSDDPRELRIKYFAPNETRIIAIRFAQISWTATSISVRGRPTIFLSLTKPPSFESEATPERMGQIQASLRPNGSVYDIEPRHRLVAFDDECAQVAPYTSLAIRLICKSETDVIQFRRLGKVAQLPEPQDFDYSVEYRGLFSDFKLAALQEWLRVLNFEVAFQVESITRALILDVSEMLELQVDINRLARIQGAEYTAAFLRHFSARARILSWDYNDSNESKETVPDCFKRCLAEFKFSDKTARASGDPVFDCLHVVQTPTTMYLEGPFPERSNRVIRTYPDHHFDFLRVGFADENRLSYRFDREVNGRAFIANRVGGALHAGVTVAGREFEFLAYSQSALKEHSVWYIKPFYHQGKKITAATIIDSLGSFADLAFDQRLIYCPARYGARISQAFTATESSISVEVEELFNLDDVEVDKFTDDPAKGTWCFTDGVGTMSSDLARAIGKELQARTRRGKKIKTYPRALQVRFMGSKGMLSVDHKLSGRAICLRPSMIKFDAPDSMEIEIAQVFDKPGRYFLNRPLIILLEGLGVKEETFQHYQDLAVQEVQKSTESITVAARFLEAHGLGVSYRMTSVLLGMHRLNIDQLYDTFYQQTLEAAIHHVLRELKQHARIPVPGAWTLVGIADVHGFLGPGEIFASLKSGSGKTVYLEGPVLISRSPTIHPGDVQVAHAIGRPPVGSCFEKEKLLNTVVFSIQGDRPLPSCLGGGDLDGDVYNLIPLNDLPEFRPAELYDPALYDAAPKKFLDRPSTMADVADFFVDYISSDVLGIIAINWMIISDQSEQGIFDPDCLKLGDLHSDAVDYPKSGQPVSLDKIPKLKFKAKPDWNAPETLISDSANFYESQKVIGRLFRSIELGPVLQTTHREARRNKVQARGELSLEEIMNDFHLDGISGKEDPMRDVVEDRVTEFIDTRPLDETAVEHTSELFCRYASELRTICASHSLSYTRSAMLTEEEVMVGTIVAKCSQPRKRKDLMSRLREQTTLLVNEIREELMGDEDCPLEDGLMRAFVAWELSNIEQNNFGAKSFGWIALGVVFEVIKDIEDRDCVEESRFSR